MSENQEQEFNVDIAQIGRILHFVLADGYGKYHCRPAIVVEDWPGSGQPGYVNLVVFSDGSNDGQYGVDHHYHGYGYQAGEMIIGGPSNFVNSRTSEQGGPKLTVWETSVLPNHAVKVVRTWHWPRECSHMVSPKEPIKDGDGFIHHRHGVGMVDVHNCFACKYEEEHSESRVQ